MSDVLASTSTAARWHGAPRRALVFAFHDRDGRLDDAYATYLAALIEQVDVAIVVANGELDEPSRERVAAMGARVIVRSNDGYDVWAFKTGIEAVEAEIREVDELVVANSSVFGPVRPLGEMFDAMATRDVDFWGITRHAPAVRSTRSRSRAERAHIQSYCTVLRASVLRSEAFWRYWREMPPITGYGDAVRTHELQQTGYLEDEGFTWDVYVDTRDLEPTMDNPMIAAAPQIIEERRCPVFKRRMLYLGLDGLLSHTDGGAGATLWSLLRSLDDVDVRIYEDHAVRTLDPSALQLSIQDTIGEGSDVASLDEVAVAVLPGPMAADALRHWTSLLPADRVVVLARSSERGAKALAEHAGVRLVDAGTGPHLAGLGDIDAAHVLVLGDIPEASSAEDARVVRRHVERIMWDADALGRAVAALHDRHVAVVTHVAPLARHAFGAIGGDDAPGTKRARDVAARLGATSLARTEHRAVPGAAALVRRADVLDWLERVRGADALGTGLAHHEWLTVLLLSLQVLGRRARLMTSDAVARTQTAVLTGMLARINDRLGTREGEAFDVASERLVDALDWTLFFDVGSGYRHTGAIHERIDAGDDIVVRATVPKGTIGIRFDPCEGTGIVVQDATVEPAGYRITPANGTRARGVDVFSWPDPVYEITGPMRAGDRLVIRLGSAERLTGATPLLAQLEARVGGASAVARAKGLAGRAMRKGSRLVRRELGRRKR